ncbi:translesion DNA synthesis-associated protein ImuA [Salinisphaera aquimarina]|uniref:Translesion DNA synthesis-associated protein ImuA n=1 Tax=Salinisphaera aquimarina TaxID=2094031 RepID=A0ABV7EUE6_9GAMM
MQNIQTSAPVIPRDHADLEAYWRRFGVHRASQKADLPAVRTGWPRLDRLLPGGGYPLGAVTELLISHAGVGELSLLLPALAARLEAQPQQQLAFISPPQHLNAPALAAAGIDCARTPVLRCADDSERLWCVEQMARSKAFCGFIVWSDTLDARALRRLQLAAEQANCPVFVYRPIRDAGERSPAALRLAITARRSGQTLEIIKCRGPAGARITGMNAGRDVAWLMHDSAPQASRASTIKQCRADNDTPTGPHPSRRDPVTTRPASGMDLSALLTVPDDMPRRGRRPGRALRPATGIDRARAVRQDSHGTGH